MKVTERALLYFSLESGHLTNTYCDCEKGSKNCKFCFVFRLLLLFTVEDTTWWWFILNVLKDPSNGVSQVICYLCFSCYC